MRIRHIEVEDFLGYARESLSLPLQGVVAICGVSGTGKSSLIVDAVGFALFGYKATRAERIEELRRQGAPGKAMRVLVAFETEDGARVEVERGLDDTGRTFARYRDSHGVEATAPKGVDTELRTLIGAMSWQVYYRAFVARQRELAVMTEAGGTERRQFIHRMLGIDAFDNVSRELRRRVRAAEGIVRYIEEEIAGTEGDPATEITAATARHDALASVAQEARAHATQQRAAAEAAEAQLVPLRQVRATLAEHQATLTRAEATEPDLIAALEALAGEDAEAAVREATLHGAEAARAALDVAQEDKARADRQAAAEDERGRLLAERAERQAERDAIDLTPPEGYGGPDLERVIALLGELEADGRHQRTERARLEENKRVVVEDGACVTCLRPTDGDEGRRLEEIFAREIEALDADLLVKRTQYAELVEIRQQAAQFEAAGQAHARAHEHATALDAQLVRIDARLEEIATSLGTPLDRAAALDALAAAEAAVAEVTAAEQWLAEHADRATRREKLEGRLERLRTARTAAEEFLAEHPGADDLDGAEAAARALAAEAAEAEVEATRQEGELQALQVEVTRLSERAAALVEQQERLRAKRAEVTRNRDLDALTVSFRGELAAGLRPQLEEMCSQVMSLLSQGKHPALRIDEDYEIALSRGDGEWLPIRMISGGEDTRANFALRLALTRLITDRTGAPFEYLILDEIFESQDQGHRERMLDVLRGVQTLYPQVFLISHVGDLHQSAAVDYVIDVADGDGPGRVTLRAL